MTLFIVDDRGLVRDAFSRKIIRHPEEIALIQAAVAKKTGKKKPTKNKS